MIVIAISMTVDLLVTYQRSYDKAIEAISATIDRNIKRYNSKEDQELKSHVGNLISHIDFLKVKVLKP